MSQIQWVCLNESNTMSMFKWVKYNEYVKMSQIQWVYLNESNTMSMLKWVKCNEYI